MTGKQKRVLWRIIISAVLLIAAAAADAFAELSIYIRVVIYLVPYLVIGYDILKKALFGMFKGRIFDENFLMAVATIGAVALGEFTEGVAVMLFYQIGELFQSCAVGKSRRNIAELMDIRPDYANIRSDGEIKRVDPEEVEPDSEIIVNPGERIPIDGIIIEGATTLDTRALTGESIPRTCAVGDEVHSGSINISGVIHIRTTKCFEDSTVSKILELVEESSMKKSRSENFITRFAKYYTPAVCIGALALAILPPVLRLISGIEPMWQEWMIRALTFLVISCPCALVISIPMSFFSGIGCASKSGILVKGSNYLEALSETKYVAFDKTGTLTKGVFEVSGVYPQNGWDEASLIFYTAHAEHASSHPIAHSLRTYYGKEPETDRIKDTTEEAGFGVCAYVDGKKVLTGNLKYMEKNCVSTERKDTAGTVVYTAVDGEYLGCIVISDTIKATSAGAIQELKHNGIEKTVILTGDSRESAEAIGEIAGADEVISGLLPEDKVRCVEELLAQKSGKEKLAYVGDGINDAPVLSRADIGIAMGALGSDAAIEAADIVLMDDDPKKISLAMRISKKTLGIVKENIVFALGVKFACLVLGAIGIANMWIAIFADVGVMVIAVINATRALNIKDNR